MIAADKRRRQCWFCPTRDRKPAIAHCEIDKQTVGVCLEHFRSALGCGFHPRIDGQDIVCHWLTPLTEAEVERLVRAQGDCVEAGVPCERHRGGRVPMEHDDEFGEE